MVKPEVHFEIAMALAPIPSARDPDKREAAENRVTTAAMAVMAVMAGIAPLRGPLSISLTMTYPPSSSMRKGHVWRTTNPSAWALASFILPLLQGIVYESGGQVAKLEVEKVFGSRPLTVIVVKALVGLGGRLRSVAMKASGGIYGRAWIARFRL